MATVLGAESRPTLSVAAVCAAFRADSLRCLDLLQEQIDRFIKSQEDLITK